MLMPKIKVFYGWWIVLACAIIGGYGAGTFFYGFSAFVDPLKEDFGWSETAIGFVGAFRIVEFGVATPIMGILVDRWGPRRLMFWGGILTGLGFLLLSQVNSFWTFVGAFVFVSFAASTCSGVVLTTPVAHWFHRRVGLAMGLLTAGFGLGGFLVKAVIWLVDGHGWETGFFVIGIGAWVLMAPLALVVRHKPEPYGYLPDGVDHLSPSEKASVIHSSSGFSPKEAVATRAFWLISLAIMIQFAGMNAVIVFVLSYLEDTGIESGTAGWINTMIPIFSIFGRFGFGWLGDHFPKARVLAIAITLEGIGLLAFAYSPGWWALTIFLITFCPGYGGVISLRPIIQREYFGLKAFGSIQGMVIAIMTVGGFVGPILAGQVFNLKDSYEMAWVIFAVAAFSASALVLSAKRPQNHSQI